VKFEVTVREDIAPGTYNRFVHVGAATFIVDRETADRMMLDDADGTNKIVVVDDSGRPLTGEMDADQWNAWKEQNAHLFR